MLRRMGKAFVAAKQRGVELDAELRDQGIHRGLGARIFDLGRTAAARLTLDRLGCQPLSECGVYPRLPAWTAGTKSADNFLIQADGNLLLRWLFVRATRSAQRGYRCTYAATGRSNRVSPFDLGLSRRPSDGVRLGGSDLGRAKVR